MKRWRLALTKARFSWADVIGALVALTLGGVLDHYAMRFFLGGRP